MSGSRILRSFLVADFGVSGCQLPFACAVSAYDEEDALGQIRATYTPNEGLLRPGTVEELSPEAIQQRIGNFDFGIPLVHGIWYPHLSNP